MTVDCLNATNLIGEHKRFCLLQNSRCDITSAQVNIAASGHSLNTLIAKLFFFWWPKFSDVPILSRVVNVALHIGHRINDLFG